MRLVGITKSGLIALTLAVAALWGCVAMEHRELRHARRDLEAMIRLQNRMRGRMLPANGPVAPSAPHSPFWRPGPSAS